MGESTHDWARVVEIGHLADIRREPTVFAPGGVTHLILEVWAYAADEGRRHSVRSADTPGLVLNGPPVHEFLQEMHREVFGGRPPGLLTVGETPGCSVEEAVLYTDPSRPGFTRVDQLRDVESLNHYTTAVARGEDPADVISALANKGRENARVPMSWDASLGAGFTTGTPWLDLHPLSGSVNAAAQVDDPGSVFSHHRRLIALRHAEPCVARGSFRMLLADHEQLYCFERSLADTRLLVVANLSSAADVVPDLSKLSPWSSAETLIASVPGSAPAPTDPLAPWESRVFRLA